MFFQSLLSCLLSLLFSFPEIGQCEPITEASGPQYHSTQSRETSLPLLTLPYGTWQASRYDAADDIYWFKNIRFGAPPVGELRWAKPFPPAPNYTVQTGDYGPVCPQNAPAFLVTPIDPTGGVKEDEDCLFLDLVVPGKALRGEAKLPVVNWIYGGAYVTGSKEGLFDGGPIVKQSNNSLVYVVGNYRLGGLGFLAGTTMEEQGTPNVGLHDQVAVFQWIQNFISLVGGDPTDVNVWGESAGAGSILHHLVAFGGKLGPAKFKRAILQSPANNPQPDRHGALEKQFQHFVNSAGCVGQGLPCLRKVDWRTIKAITIDVANNALPGQFGVGPAVDGTFSRQLPDLELASGNIVQGVESFILTHVSHEANIFVNSSVKDNHTFFNEEISSTFGPDPAIRDAIDKKYPPPGPGSPYADEQQRFIAYMGKSSIYVGEFGFGPGFHGTDLPVDFYNSSAEPFPSAPGIQAIAPTYQGYLLSHAIAGDPNVYSENGTQAPVRWPIVQWGDILQPALLVGNTSFSTIRDEDSSADMCNIWLSVWSRTTQNLGLVPVGGYVPSDIS